MAYQPRHAIIGVEIDGCDFTTDTEFLPWVHKQTTEGIERYQPCVVHGVKINGVWFDACAMGDDFIEEIEYEIQQMPLNAEGDIDDAAICMGKAEMQKRAAAVVKPEFPAGAIVNGRTLLDRLESTYSFECEAGPLRLCSDFQELKRCFEHLAEHAVTLQS